MSKFLEETTLVEAQADDKENELISQLISDYGQMVRELNETGRKLAEEQQDQPTIDLLNELQGKFEKHIWIFNAYLAYE